MDIYVGSIPFKWKEKNLQEMFEAFGEVTSVKIILDKITRQNKGFGFVTMPNDIEAKNAIAALHGSDHEGRNILVNISIPKSELPPKRRESTKRQKPDAFKPEKRKKQLPPWLRKEY